MGSSKEMKDSRDLIIKILLVLVVAVLVAGGYFYFRYQSQRVEYENYRIEKGDELKVLKEKYGKEAKILSDTVDRVTAELEKEKVKSKLIIKWKTKTNTVTERVEVPAECILCFEKIDSFGYAYPSTYFTLTSEFGWDKNKSEFTDLGSSIKFTNRFKEMVELYGLQEFQKNDLRTWRIRQFFAVDGGIKIDDNALFNGFSYAGIGYGIEFMNLLDWFKAPVGVNVAGYLVPQQVLDSHVSIGVDYRVFYNIFVGVGYGRSLVDNMITLNVGVFPFKE